MTTGTAIAVALFVSTWLLANFVTPYAERLGRRFEILDEPAERKVHESAVPRSGGIAIFVVVSVVVLAAVFFIPAMKKSFFLQPYFYASLSGGAALVFAVGLWDDIQGAGVWSRLGVETAAAAIVVFAGGVLIDKITIPFVGRLPLGELAVPLTITWIVGITNALNIIDGLDGLAGGIAFIACFGVFVVALMNGDTMAMASLALLAGACLGFLRYNAHPARIFLGDSGSLLLGFLLACIAVETSLKRSTGLALIIPMQMLAVPLLDTLYSMARRVVRDVTESEEVSLSSLKAMFESDREHIHHILVDVGFSHPRAVWILYGLSSVIVVFGLLSALTLDDRASLMFLLAGIAGFLIIRHFGDTLPFIRRWKKAERESQKNRSVGSTGREHSERESEEHREEGATHGSVRSDRESSGPHSPVAAKGD